MQTNHTKRVDLPGKTRYYCAEATCTAAAHPRRDRRPVSRGSSAWLWVSTRTRKTCYIEIERILFSRDRYLSASPLIMRRPCRRRLRLRRYSSVTISRNCSQVNTGPSMQTYFAPILHRPQMPTPHFMRFSRVVTIC